MHVWHAHNINLSKHFLIPYQDTIHWHINIGRVAPWHTDVEQTIGWMLNSLLEQFRKSSSRNNGWTVTHSAKTKLHNILSDWQKALTKFHLAITLTTLCLEEKDVYFRNSILISGAFDPTNHLGRAVRNNDKDGNPGKCRAKCLKIKHSPKDLKSKVQL